MNDQIFSYREMCDLEGVQVLQRGMNFEMKPEYSVILMSRRANAPYPDKVLSDGITIEYVGHDEPKTSYEFNPKITDQSGVTKYGKLTQNGLFSRAVDQYKQEKRKPELIKAYEKILPGVWSMKGYFDLMDYRYENDGKRNIFIFTLRLNENIESRNIVQSEIKHNRLIPSEVKKQVWIRDGGKCVICGSTTNLHFDHDLPFSKGGTSLTAKNVRLLCMKCNLAKSDKIE